MSHVRLTGRIVVVEMSDQKRGTPLFCPVCDFIMNSLYDDETYRTLTCCDSCASKWAYPRRVDWDAGWRPDRSEVEDEVRRRRLMDKSAS